jgi:hypothetical protein
VQVCTGIILHCTALYKYHTTLYSSVQVSYYTVQCCTERTLSVGSVTLSSTVQGCTEDPGFADELPPHHPSPSQITFSLSFPLNLVATRKMAPPYLHLSTSLFLCCRPVSHFPHHSRPPMPLASQYKDGTTAEKDKARGMVGN